MQPLDISQYMQALQNPKRAFFRPDLASLKVRRHPVTDMPRSFVGGFALVFELYGKGADGSGDLRIAVRCFKRLLPDLAERYARVSTVLRRHSADSRFFLTTDYHEKGVLAGGDWQPITTLRWFDGRPFNEFVEDAHRDRSRLERMLAQLKQLSVDLERWQIAHGDLQHGNILVGKDDHVKLIDYDGMFVPTLRGWSSNEAGHADYRHPDRQGEAAATMFDGTLDRFPLIVLYLQVAAVAAHPELWSERPPDDEGLLLHEADFRTPGRSETLARMSAHEDLRRAVERLSEIAADRIDRVPTLATFISESGVLVPRHALPPVRPVTRSDNQPTPTPAVVVAAAPPKRKAPVRAVPRAATRSHPVFPASPLELRRSKSSEVEVVGVIVKRAVITRGARARHLALYLKSASRDAVRVLIPESAARQSDVSARGLVEGAWLSAVGTVLVLQESVNVVSRSLDDLGRITQIDADSRVSQSRRRGAAPSSVASSSSKPAGGRAKPKRRTPKASPVERAPDQPAAEDAQADKAAGLSELLGIRSH